MALTWVILYLFSLVFNGFLILGIEKFGDFFVFLKFHIKCVIISSVKPAQGPVSVFPIS